jgi:23S rRNA A2030 N6-methylase RlmJ
MKKVNELNRLNNALKDSGKRALERHAKVNQPIVFRDKKNRMVKKYSNGKIEVMTAEELSISF